MPSLTVLKLMKDAGDKNSKQLNRKELFAMGSAVYGDSDSATSRSSKTNFFSNEGRGADVDLRNLKWQNLTGTSRELEQVSSLFPESSRKVITGLDASERNLKQLDKNGDLAQYKRILFATHGLFIAAKPELSSIVLSQGLNDNIYDGYVTIGEWFGYNLNSDLVCLSACETGRGDYQSGEGIIGLPYALTIVGNKDTVMSIWEVDDEGTADWEVLPKVGRGAIGGSRA